jgi:hypothetical protein
MDLLTKNIVAAKELVWRNIDGEAFLMTEDGKKVHMLNKVGTLIWQCADGSIPVNGIIDRIIERFEVDEETARSDCLEFIEELMDMKIIKVAE